MAARSQEELDAMCLEGFCDSLGQELFPGSEEMRVSIQAFFCVEN